MQLEGPGERADAKAADGGPPDGSGGVPIVVTVQYLRALAAALVVMHHALNIEAFAPYYTRTFGASGVDLFFVISGFIMWATTAGNADPNPAKFWSARCLRVIPLYWIFTSLFIAIALAAPGATFTAAIEPIHVLKSYLFIPAVHPGSGKITPTYTLGWTLNYEMFFYLLFGLCLLIRTKTSRLLALVGALTGLVLAGTFAEPEGAIAKTYTNPILLEFAAGSIIAWIAPQTRGIRPAVGWALIAGALAWMICAYTRDVVPDRVIAHGGSAVVLLAGALVLEPWARERINATGLLLGNASYSIYLAHPFGLRIWYFVFNRVFGTTSLAPGSAYVISAIFVGLASGVASYIMIEKPLLRAGKRWRQTAKHV